MGKVEKGERRWWRQWWGRARWLSQSQSPVSLTPFFDWLCPCMQAHVRAHPVHASDVITRPLWSPSPRPLPLQPPPQGHPCWLTPQQEVLSYEVSIRSPDLSSIMFFYGHILYFVEVDQFPSDLAKWRWSVKLCRVWLFDSSTRMHSPEFRMEYQINVGILLIALFCSLNNWIKAATFVYTSSLCGYALQSGLFSPSTLCLQLTRI